MLADNYYIIRLASRRGITLRKELKDMKDTKSKKIYDDHLFGIIYKELNWDKD